MGEERQYGKPFAQISILKKVTTKLHTIFVQRDITIALSSEFAPELIRIFFWCTLQYRKQIRAHPLKIGQDYFEGASFIFRHFQYPGGAFYGSGKWYFYPRATNWGGSGECFPSKYEIVGKFKILSEKNEHNAVILREIKRIWDSYKIQNRLLIYEQPLTTSMKKWGWEHL